MIFFNKERTVEFRISTKRFKKGIPCVHFLPKIDNDDTKIFIFVNGIGATLTFGKILNYEFFNNHFLVVYEKMGHGNNENKAKRMPSKYAVELNDVVNYYRNMFPSKKIYLLGESWGSSIVIFYLKKFNNVSGAVFWNMPKYVIDVSYKPWKDRILIGFKMVPTILFGMQTWDKHPGDTSEQLSSNIDFKRFSKISHANAVGNNLSNIAAWWSMKASWKWLERHMNSDEYKFIYIQSGEDKLAKQKFIDLLNSKYHSCPKYKFLSTGYHILISEEPANEELFKIVNDFVKSD